MKKTKGENQGEKKKEEKKGIIIDLVEPEEEDNRIVLTATNPTLKVQVINLHDSYLYMIKVNFIA